MKAQIKANIFIVVDGCSININGDLSDPQPLLIKPGTSAFLYPNNRTGIVYLDFEEEIEIYCTGSGLKIPAGAGNSAVVKCVEGNLFEFNGTSFSFINFSCNVIPYHTTRKTGGRCFNNGTSVEVGFDLENRFLKVFEVCHDEVSEETYYAKYQLTPASEGSFDGSSFKGKIIFNFFKGFQRSFPRPSFITGGFFGGKNVDALYSRFVQRETIAGIIGSFELAQKYVEETSDIFMARGHLAAKADFIYGSQVFLNRPLQDLYNLLSRSNERHFTSSIPVSLLCCIILVKFIICRFQLLR